VDWTPRRRLSAPPPLWNKAKARSISSMRSSTSSSLQNWTLAWRRRDRPRALNVASERAARAVCASTVMASVMSRF